MIMLNVLINQKNIIKFDCADKENTKTCEIIEGIKGVVPITPL